jgi:uncharacterized Zn-finger protein
MSLLEKHTKSHEGAKVHTCKVCSKEFSRFNHLKRHMTSHSVVRPFSCDVCAKKFSRRDHLQQHVRLHDKKQEYQCDICLKTFNRADQLAKHKVSKHNVGEKVGRGRVRRGKACEEGLFIISLLSVVQTKSS